MARWDTAGTVGHVVHGKLTVVKVILGVMTVHFKNELLGYANVKGCYRSYHSNKEDHPLCEVMDAALLLIAGNGSCPQPQISEHPTAVVLIKEAQVLGHQKSIAAFIKADPIPVRDFLSSLRLTPGTEVNKWMGGVACGSILAGVLVLEMRVEICPGIVTKDQQGCNRCRPIFSCIVFGAVSKLPQIYTELEISLFLSQHLLGIKTEDKKMMKVTKLVKINIGSISTGGRVLSMKMDLRRSSCASTPGSALAPDVAHTALTSRRGRGRGRGTDTPSQAV
ncbi:translation initiation factor eIF2 gamma subunit [Phellopilus nigrolimitatus]|nr:translation initiation factor eIF2 gamma subunit [Phellopilus nigrolimitatus]